MDRLADWFAHRCFGEEKCFTVASLETSLSGVFTFKVLMILKYQSNNQENKHIIIIIIEIIRNRYICNNYNYKAFLEIVQKFIFKYFVQYDFERQCCNNSVALTKTTIKQAYCEFEAMPLCKSPSCILQYVTER